MKMFTRLIGSVMMLLLISAVVVGQSQQVGSTIADQQVKEGILTEQMSSPFAAMFDQKSIENTDAVSGWVLGSGANGYSQNSRAANNYWKYQRTVYLMTAAEVAAAGFTAGELLNSIGWWNLYAGNGTLAGNLDVYILNTADASFNSSYTTWANVTAAFTKVTALTSWTVPIEEGSWSVPFTTGTYNYTGGGLYIAWQFESPAGTSGTYPVAHYTNSGTTGLLYGTRSATSTYPAMATSAFRPITYLSSYTTVADVVKITNIYTNEINAHPYAVPTPVKVQVFNVSASSVTFDVTLTGTDGYNQTVTVTNLAANTGQAVAFPNWSPAVDGDYTFTATTSAVAGEGFVENNTYLIDVNVNTDQISYSYYLQPYAYGWTYPGTGIFAEKHHMNGSGLVTGAILGIANNAASTNNTVYGVLLDAAGTILATTPAHVITTINTAVIVNFSAPILITDADYYIGMLTTQGTVQWNPMMAVTETPNRPDGFYNFPAAGGTPTAATWRYLLGAVVAPYVPCTPPTNLFASGISATNTTLNWTSNTGTSQVEWGPTGFTPTGIPGYTGTSPYVISTSPATGYDFYVRDVCAGPQYSPWVLNSFFTFCQECPGGALNEGEPQLVNGSTLAGINGGCAYGDPLLTSPIALGQTYCGQSNSYINDLNAAARDNDYYYLDLNSPANIYWNINITLQGNGLYNVTFFDAGDMTCAIGAVASVTTTAGCELATINVDVPSGNYYIVARVASAAGNLWPAGSGPWTYVLSVTGSQLGAPNLTPDAPAEITQLVAPGGSASINLPIGNSGTYDLEYSAVTSGTYSLTWDDQFDTYAAGVQLAVQNPAQWTTWSNAPGSAEDPYVSSEQAYTGSNSVKIEGVNDCVHTFGNLTSGSYLISHRMYVATGYVGYFNTLLLFNGANSEWGMQVAYEIDGTATLDAGVFSAATFNYTPDTWMLNEVYVDLDNDYAEYWFNGTFIWSWQWSVGTGGYATNQLAANNFYAYTGANSTDTPRFWIDDYKLLQAGNDWLTLDGGLGAAGTIAPGGGSININLGFDATTKPFGTYVKTINLVTNELGAKATYAIPVTMMVGYSVSGNVYYGTTGVTKPMQTNTTVTLSTYPAVPTFAGGSYIVRPVNNGTYTLTGATTKAGGGVQSADALLVQRYLLNALTLTNLQKRSSDVNLSNSITVADPLAIKRKVLVPSFNWAAPAYVFDGPFGTPPVLGGIPVTVSGANVSVELRTLCSGDVNGSFTPPAE